LEEVNEVIVTTGEGEVARDLRKNLEESAVKQLSSLEGTLKEATEDTKPVITQALQISGESYGTALETAIAGSPDPLVVGNMGTIQVLVTDPPTPESVDSVILKVETVEVHLAAGPDSGWTTILDKPKSFDLMNLIEGKEVNLGSSEINTGTYTQVRMDIAEATVIVGGEEYNAFVPSGRLKFTRPFQVKDNQTTVIIFDFDGHKSIKATGEGRYMLKPEVSLLVPEIEGEGNALSDGAETAEAEDFPKTNRNNWIGTIRSSADSEIKFQGNITSIEPLVIAEYTVVLDRAEIEGELETGLTAKVKGILKDEDIVLAFKVEVEEADGT
jgi:hypothetical protein